MARGRVAALPAKQEIGLPIRSGFLLMFGACLCLFGRIPFTGSSPVDSDVINILDKVTLNTISY